MFPDSSTCLHLVAGYSLIGCVLVFQVLSVQGSGALGGGSILLHSLFWNFSVFNKVQTALA